MQAELEERLRSKVTHVLEWHTPQREVGTNDSLQLAKITQLPQLLRQQVEEGKRTKREIEVTRQEIVDILATKHKVSLQPVSLTPVCTPGPLDCLKSKGHCYTSAICASVLCCHGDVQVLVEMCLALRECLNSYKLGVVKEANEVSLEHTTTQCAAMTGKLE